MYLVITANIFRSSKFTETKQILKQMYWKEKRKPNKERKIINEIKRNNSSKIRGKNEKNKFLLMTSKTTEIKEKARKIINKVIKKRAVS